MNNEKLDMILDQIENMSHLKSEDIPSLDLYMDQIMTLFDINLADNKRHDDDKLLTKTMINNYSKEGLLKTIKGKKSYFTNVTYLFTKKYYFYPGNQKDFTTFP